MSSQDSLIPSSVDVSKIVTTLADNPLSMSGNSNTASLASSQIHDISPTLSATTSPLPKNHATNNHNTTTKRNRGGTNRNRSGGSSNNTNRVGSSPIDAARLHEEIKICTWVGMNAIEADMQRVVRNVLSRTAEAHRVPFKALMGEDIKTPPRETPKAYYSRTVLESRGGASSAKSDEDSVRGSNKAWERLDKDQKKRVSDEMHHLHMEHYEKERKIVEGYGNRVHTDAAAVCNEIIAKMPTKATPAPTPTSSPAPPKSRTKAKSRASEAATTDTKSNSRSKSRSGMNSVPSTVSAAPTKTKVRRTPAVQAPTPPVPKTPKEKPLPSTTTGSSSRKRKTAPKVRTVASPVPKKRATSRARSKPAAPTPVSTEEEDDNIVNSTNNVSDQDDLSEQNEDVDLDGGLEDEEDHGRSRKRARVIDEVSPSESDADDVQSDVD